MAPIWTSRRNGRWLCVEQAMATTMDRPCRQRIDNVIEAEDGAVRSMVREPSNAAARVGAWRTSGVFDADAPASPRRRDGCVIRLEPGAADAWTSSTNGKDCLSTLGAASEANSEVVLRSDRIETWDRGLDAGKGERAASRSTQKGLKKTPKKDQRRPLFGAPLAPFVFRCIRFPAEQRSL